MLTLTLIIIFAALVFDFLNGFHDAANSIATIVSTRVLTPGQAVAWAAFFNFIAAFVFGTAVAKTIGTGMVHVEKIDVYVVFGGLLGQSSGTSSPGCWRCPRVHHTRWWAQLPARRSPSRVCRC